MTSKTTDPRVTKRRVTMRSATFKDGEVVTFQAVDYVRPDHLDAYVADARTRWQDVTVSKEPDAGPGGYEGPTFVPDHLPVPDAGTTYPAETKGA